MNVAYADVYGEFQALGAPFLLANYYTFDMGGGVMDPVHYTQASQAAAAQIVLDLFQSVNPALTLTITPATATEGDGVLTGAATVSLSLAMHDDLVVNLNSNDTNELTVPATVTIIAGTTSATFDLTVIDDAVSDPDQLVTVTASAAGYQNGTDTITIRDNGPRVTLALPAHVQEGDGVITGGGTVSINAAIGSDLVVSLNSDDTTELMVPVSVTILATNTSVQFDLTVIDDAVTDADITVTVTATAAGYNDGTDTVEVWDIDYVPPVTKRKGTDGGGCLPGQGAGIVIALLALAVLAIRKTA
ncbi:MAG: hypothetical protein ABIF71_02800 [Planctomycetota bacterium]